MLGKTDTSIWWLQKFRMCFSQNLLFGFTALLNPVDDISVYGTFYELYYLVRWCRWKNIRFSLTVTGWSWEGHPAVKCCYNVWQFSVQFSVKGGLETSRFKVPLTVGLVLDLSIARSPINYHIKILKCVYGMLAQWEVDQMRWLK